MSTGAMDEEPLDSEFGDKLRETMFSTWIDNELLARGGALSRTDIYRAVVELPSGGGIARVRINDEASLQARAIASKPIAKGDLVTPENVQAIEAFWPIDIDPNSGWLAYAVVGPRAMIAFDTRYNKAKTAVLLSLADDYLSNSIATHERFPRPAIDNLPSAAELAGQAQMLAQAQETRVHDVRSKWLQASERLGNVPQGFNALLRRLRKERAAARYGDGDVTIGEEEMPQLFATVRAMIEHASSQVGVPAAGSEFD